MLCDELLRIEARCELPEWCRNGLDKLQNMCFAGRGSVVCAALAAAECANAAEQHVADPAEHPTWIRKYPDRVGGGRGQGDMVTDWLQNRLHAIVLEGLMDHLPLTGAWEHGR